MLDAKGVRLILESVLFMCVMLGVGWLYDKYYDDFCESHENVPLYTIFWLVFYGLCRVFQVGSLFVIALAILINLVYRKDQRRDKCVADIFAKNTLGGCCNRIYFLSDRVRSHVMAWMYLRQSCGCCDDCDDCDGRVVSYNYLLYLTNMVLNSKKQSLSALKSSQIKYFRRFLEIENSKHAKDKYFGDDFFQYMLDHPEEDIWEYFETYSGRR